MPCSRSKYPYDKQDMFHLWCFHKSNDFTVYLSFLVSNGSYWLYSYHPFRWGKEGTVAVHIYVPCSCGGLKTAWTYSPKGVAGIWVIRGAAMEAKNKNCYRGCRDLHVTRTGSIIKLAALKTEWQLGMPCIPLGHAKNFRKWIDANLRFCACFL